MKDAYIKHYFLKKGIKPAEVDNMDADLVLHLINLSFWESEERKFKDMEYEAKQWQKKL